MIVCLGDFQSWPWEGPWEMRFRRRGLILSVIDGPEAGAGEMPQWLPFFSVFWHTGASSWHNRWVVMKDGPLVLSMRHLVGVSMILGRVLVVILGSWTDLVHICRVLGSP